MKDKITSESKGNARSYRSVNTKKMTSSNMLKVITKWKYEWKSSSGYNSTCDFKELKAYSTDEHIRLLISKVELSGWRESTKVNQFRYIRRVLRYAFESQEGKKKSKVTFSPDTCAQYIHAQYLSMASKGVGIFGKPISIRVLGQEGSNLNSICKKFGFGTIPKGSRNLTTHSASLDSDNYTTKQLRLIALGLLENRALLLKRYNDDLLSQAQRRIAFDKLVCNAVFLTIYYLGSGQTETLNMFLDDEWTFQKSGAGRPSQYRRLENTHKYY